MNQQHPDQPGQNHQGSRQQNCENHRHAVQPLRRQMSL